MPHAVGENDPWVLDFSPPCSSFPETVSVACSEPNQQCDSSCLRSFLAKERINYKPPLLQLPALASHTLTSSVTSGAVTDPC